MNIWQKLDTKPQFTDGWCFWWIVAKTPEEIGRHLPVGPFTSHAPYLHYGRHGSWGSLSKATHWAPGPVSDPDGNPL
jgi:hypothetical protein